MQSIKYIKKKKRPSKIFLAYIQQINFTNPVPLSVFLTVKQLSKGKM